MKRFFVGLILILVCTLPSMVAAYTLSGPKWPQSGATFYVDITGSGGLFNTGFETAISRWNAATPYFQFSTVRQFGDPCSNPNGGTIRNGVKFDTMDCGVAFGASTLAVTHTWSSGGSILQSGMVFNSTKTWDVYSGPYQGGSHAGVQDFARVAVHELGHSLGLSHENSLQSIMASAFVVGSTIEVPQTDDVNGVQALYGPPLDTVIPSVTIGSPTSGPTYTTGTATLSMAGTASDNVGVNLVTWTNSRGGFGTCSFTGSTSVSWNCNGIGLSVGVNVLTVAARDAAGNFGSAVLIVTYSPTQPPVISGVYSAPGITGSAIITWTTDIPSDSQVEFGTTTGYGQAAGDGSLTTSHSVPLSGLSLNTTYHYRVKSSGTVGNLSTSGDSTLTTFSISNLGGVSWTTDGLGTGLLTGYGRIQPGTGSTTPSGVAIFGFRQGGVLASEAGVPDSPLISAGRTYAEVSSGGAVNTGLALVNPNSVTARVFFDLRDRNGNIVRSGFKDFAPREHSATFLDQDPYLSGLDFQGTFSFTSTLPVSAIALRGFYNERTPSDFLMSTLEVMDLSVGARTGTQVIPHFAAGGGFTTQILLVNPTALAQTGTIEFREAGGGLTVVNIDGAPGSGANYAVAPNGVMKFLITAASASLAQGSVRVLPAGGGQSPTPFALFSYKPAGITVSEASVPVTMGSAFRMYVELSPASLINSGIAIANASGISGNVTLSVTDLNGSLVASRTLTLGAYGQIVDFLDNLIPSLAGQSLQGVLRITTSLPISVIGLRSHYNERSPQRDFLMASTPPSLETALPASAEKFFPQIANGVSFTTQVILFSGTAGQSANGDLIFFQTGNAASLNLDLH